jgi:hypothetical protein
MKCMIAVSVSREWNETEFLKQMGTWHLPADWQIRFGWFAQFTAAERHNIAVNEAKYNFDRIIFMDTDQVYPPDYIRMLLAHQEPIVTGLNVSRYYPYECTTYKITGEQKTDDVIFPTFEYMTPPTDRIFECDMTGTGAMMINPHALEDVKLPYFQDIYDEAGCVRHLCDDFYFCWKLHKAGIKVTVDQDIVVKHIAKILVSPYNRREMKVAWEAINSGHGYWKDGKR